VAGTHEAATRAREVQQHPGVPDGHRERLLDVDVGAGLEGRVGGLAVCRRWRADVDEVRPRLGEELVARAERAGRGEPRELLRRRRRAIVDADHDGGDRQALHDSQVMAGHLAGPDEGDTKGSGGHWVRYLRR